MVPRPLMRAALLVVLGPGCAAGLPNGDGATVQPAEHAKEAAAADGGGHGEVRYALPGLDHGLIQSPVNILSAEAKPGEHTIAVSTKERGARAVQNKGYTIELEFPAGSTVTFDGKAYELAQVHFHTPSEHEIDGVTFPMEMHAVTTRKGGDPGGPPEYLVMGALFRMGASSEFIDRFLDAVPKEAGQENPTGKGVVVSLLFGTEAVPETWPAYYHYSGSLTTPPYSETVQWLVFKEVFQASPEQIIRINGIEGNNARHVQALFGRDVDG